MEDEVRDGEEQIDTTVPEMWKLAKPPNPDSESGKPGPGAQVGKLVKLLNDIEENEEFENKLSERDPATGHSLLLWATLTSRFVLVEWLVKRGKRSAFAFSNSAKELTVYDKWVEIRKEVADKEKEKAEQPPEEEDEEGEKAPEPTVEQLVFDALSDLHEEFGIRAKSIVKSIGELGVYQGARDEGHNKCGLGQSLYPNGDMYVGQYKDNQRQGVGTYWFANDGMIYQGQWKHNVREGIGRMVFADGGRFFGSWVNNKRNGQGRYTYPDGSSYAGEWVEDVKEGHGAVSFNDGSQYIGTFVKGEFVSGEWRLAGGTRYFGTFENWKPQGKGMFVFRSGKEGSFQQVGSYVNGEWAASGVTATASKPEVQLASKEKELAVTYTTECENAPLEMLLRVVNLPQFRDWAQVVSSAEEINLSSLAVRGLRVHEQRVEAVDVKVGAAHISGKRLQGQSVLTLTGSSTYLAVLLSTGASHIMVLQQSPRPSSGSASFVSLPRVDVQNNGDLSGDFVRLVSELGVQASTATTLSVSEGPFHTDLSSSDAKAGVFLYIQQIHPSAVTSINQHIAKLNTPGSFTKLRAVPLEEVISVSSDALTITIGSIVTEMVSQQRLPTQTVQPQRPPTPDPPQAEGRPDIAQLLEAEKQRQKLAEAKQDD